MSDKITVEDYILYVPPSLFDRIKFGLAEDYAATYRPEINKFIVPLSHINNSKERNL